jgi:hypothetical protein
MTALVSSKSQDHLAKVATRFSMQVEARLAGIQREIQDRLDREAAVRAHHARKQREEEKRQTQWLKKRMPLARVGLARILAVGKNELVQKIILNLKRIQSHSGVVMFYEAHRLSGDAFGLPDKEIDFEPGTRDVEFLFYSDHLRIFCGSFSAGQGITWEIFYHPCETSAAVLMADPPSQEKEKTVEEFLADIASPYPSNMSVASHWRQRSHEWDPEAIAFQLLVSCARPARLNNYLKELRPAVPV